MRWRGRAGSGNIEDRRGMGPGGLVLGGGLGSVLLVVIVMLMGGDPTQLFEQAPSGGGRQGTPPANDETATFVSVVLKDTEDVWGELFRTELRRTYEQPKLVLFSGRVSSACGLASAAPSTRSRTSSSSTDR